MDGQWSSLDLRRPSGVGIVDLQSMAKSGKFSQKSRPDSFLDTYDYEEKLTDEEIADFKEAFAFFDKSGDGTMESKDLGVAMRSLGVRITDAELKGLISEIDPDNNGSLDVNDFLSCMAEYASRTETDDDIRQSFSCFNKDDSEFVSVEEFSHVLMRLGDRLSTQEVQDILALVDPKGTGLVKVEDLVSCLNKRTAVSYASEPLQ
eukprot:GILI01003307.1.p1 GENE.GILI01003307.1~~GILI01003307.1.p1  ORF type:complete len:205 (+),score=27.25 GILI01003307.1:87-701(+)